MATKIAKTSTIRGKRLQAVTIATTNLAMGTEAIGFENGVVFGVFVDVAMLYYRQSEKKPAKAPLTQKCGCGVAPTKATLIYRRTGNLRAVQLLLGHTKIESTVQYLGIEVDDVLAIAEQVDV